MRRREFIAGAATWPMVAHAQQAERVRRVGVMISAPEDDQAYQYLIAVFREGLAKLGWVEGRNLQIYLRFGAPSAVRVRASAEELVSLNPDLIITSGTAATAAVQQETQTIAIVFVAVGDPVANGIVKNVARPEGNTTGVTNLFASFGGKWLGLIKEAVPRVERAALVYSPQLVTEIGAGSLLLSIEEAARVLAVKTIGIPFSNTLDIVRGIDAFAVEPNGALIVLPPPPSPANRETIRRLAIQYRLPTISAGPPTEGDLMSYGPNMVDLFRHASSYVDRILRGTRVNELPVEYPTRFELILNLKTAKAIDLIIPDSFLVRADKVIE